MGSKSGSARRAGRRAAGRRLPRRLGAVAGGALLALLAAHAPGASHAQKLSDPGRESLAGLGPVLVMAEPQGSRAALEGIRAKLLETAVTTQLRAAGIRVATLEQAKTVPGSPFLFLRVGLVKRQGRETYVYNVTLQLHQVMSMARKPEAYMYGMTWQSGGALGLAGTSERLAEIKRAVAGQVDQFVNSYRTANRKR